MKVALQIIRGAVQAVAEEQVQIRRAVVSAVRGAGDDTKAAVRAHVTAGLGARAGRSVRSIVYENRGADAAAVVFHKFYRKGGGTKSDVLAAFDEPATIEPRSSKWLAIPLLDATGRGKGGRKPTVADVESRLNRDLDLVRLPDGRMFLVGKGRRAKSRKTGRLGTAREAKPGQGDTIFLFRLVRRVKLPKRIDRVALERQSQDAFARRLVVELGEREALR